MSRVPGDHPRDDLAAYALDALEGPERVALEAHLAACAECQGDLVAYRETLSSTVGDEAPPPGLWHRIVDEIGPGDAAGVGRADAGPGAWHPRHLRPRHPRRRLLALAAAAALVLAALAGGTALWDRAGDDDTPEVVAPDLPRGTIVAEDGTPVARVDADEGGSFVDLSDAAPLTADRTYQLWSLDGPQPAPLGLLGTGGEDDVRVTLPGGTTLVAISDEPAGGSPQPTGPIVGTGSLALPS